MNKKKNVTQNNIFVSEFKQFYRQELISELKEVEIKRKLFLFLILVSSLLCLCTFAYLVFLELTFFVGFNDGKYLFLAALLFSIIPFVLRKKYKNYARKIILEKLLNFAGDFTRKSHDNIEAQVIALHIFESFNKFTCLNRFSGKYKLSNMDISEIKMDEEENVGIMKRSRRIFEGLLIKIENTKKNQGYTIVCKRPVLKHFSGVKVQFDDTEFNRYFDVYSDRKAEAKYVITKTFMDRMVELVKRGLCDNVIVSFENGDIYISIEAQKNWIQLSVTKPADKIDNYRTFILDLITLMKISSSLGLEKKVGL